ncbi:tuberin-like [Clavelina lepadiformis]|uniref:tuberin-like n=1 Tax=Clavelina lepadiformis TaxID=159417 RepID=UPI004042BCC9
MSTMAESKDSHSNRKSWFKILGLGSSKNQSPNVSESQTTNILTEDFWVALSTSSSLESRVNKLHQFGNLLETKQLERRDIEKIWVETKDLLKASIPPNVRKTYFEFLRRLITCQYRQLGMLVPMFYHELKMHSYMAEEDIANHMLIVNALTDHGKNIYMLEQEIGPHLVQWMDQLGGDEVYLSLLLNIIKFNSSHLGREIVKGIVQHLCDHANSPSSIKELQSLLKVLDAIICYNSLPQECLQGVIFTMCRAVSLKEMCDQSWKLMRNLLGTHLGHSCIGIMCQILESEPYEDFSVSRSAVFFIGMGLWGSKCVTSLMYKPQSILPSFQYSLKSRNAVVGFEIALTCQRLVKKFGHDLHVSAWDNILIIIPMLLEICVDGTHKLQKLVSKTTHDLLTLIEQLYETQAFNGSVEKLFEITSSCLKDRPTESILLLLTHQSQSIRPGRENWITGLNSLMEKYYKASMDTAIRLNTLEILSTIVLNNMDVYEKDLLDVIVLPLLQNVSLESESAVLDNAIEFLLQVSLKCKTSRCIHLLQLLKSFVQLRFNFDSLNAFSAVECALQGIVKVFLVKLHSPHSSHAIEAYHWLIDFLDHYYENDNLLKQPATLWSVRKEVLAALFQIRANSKLLVRLSNSSVMSSVTCFNAEASLENDFLSKLPQVRPSSGNLMSVYLPFCDAFSCFVQCLEKERYWPVLEVTLNGLFTLLDNRILILSVGADALDHLAEALTGLISNATRMSTLICAPKGFKRSDLQASTLYPLTVLTSFHEYLHISRQRQILRCLESGFTTRCAKQCICAISLCMIGMTSDALVRVLPSILLHLSQMSATTHLAPAVLELLSSLSQLPTLYANFVEDQYMSVFAIALQHANPAKYSLYIVSLAHHVISMWFVKCRLSFRPDFIQYIARNLQNVNRTKSSDSLQHSLIESCIDVMARYAFSDSMPVAKQPTQMKCFAVNGQSATWLFGNRIITIKTGRCNDHSTIPNQLPQIGDFPPLTNNSSIASDPASNDANDRKMSIEAPAKLQTTMNSNVVSMRHRHRSSGAVLKRSSGIEFPVSVKEPIVDSIPEQNITADRESALTPTKVGTSWAEINIRRPSGNTSFLLFGHQLNLVSSLAESDISDVAAVSTFPASASDLQVSQQEKINGLPALSKSLAKDGDSDDSTKQGSPLTRNRSHTVSSSQDYVQGAAARARAKSRGVASPKSRGRLSGPVASPMNDQSNRNDANLTPGFVFLQMFQTAMVPESLQRPLLLPNTATIDRAVHVLDMIPPYDTWGTGVVYVRPGQGEVGRDILCNQHGSKRYQQFLDSLGCLVSLPDCDMSHTYLGGLDQGGDDGQFTYVWQENIMQMVFHIATLMPNHENEDSSKVRHIGNDYVTVVYDDNDSPQYVPGSIYQGQFLSVEIIITPLDLGFNSVRVVYHKEEIKDMMQIREKRTVSDERLGLLVRQLSLHANMAASAYLHQKKPEYFISKPLSRLKQIKRIRSRAIQELACKNESSAARYSSLDESSAYPLEEFSDYV